MSRSAADPRGAITLTLENDVLTGSHNAYTNGPGVTWVSGDLASTTTRRSFADGDGFGLASGNNGPFDRPPSGLGGPVGGPKLSKVLKNLYLQLLG
jgi:hypothetical protein